MRIACNRALFADAFLAASAAAPARSPKPILTSVKVEATAEGTTILATDLEVSVRRQVLGVTVEEPGSAVLDAERTRKILQTSKDEVLTLSLDGGSAVVEGRRSRYELASPDPATFPAFPAPDFASHYAIPAAAYKAALRRVASFADDGSSGRMALAGVLHEDHPHEGFLLVAMNGATMGRQSLAVERVGGPSVPASAVLPVRAAKVVGANLDAEDPDVLLAFEGNRAACVRTGLATVHARLLEGRFPDYRFMVPSASKFELDLDAAGLAEACDQAAVCVSDESRAIRFAFSDGRLALRAVAPERGASDVELEVDYHGRDFLTAFDSRYIAAGLRQIPAYGPVRAAFNAQDDQTRGATLFRADGFLMLAAPITVGRKEG